MAPLCGITLKIFQTLLGRSTGREVCTLLLVIVVAINIKPFITTYALDSRDPSLNHNNIIFLCNTTKRDLIEGEVRAQL